ncbi:MAG TPA: DUF6328 family protein, partial [Acidimicrobiales bacterium]|nr:DUF6328 family protein [Acidimicrobiales bacterium]
LTEDHEDETEDQRERYRELLEELRVIMPGTQVLFAFLLTAVFSQRFKDLDDLGRRSFALAMLLAALAVITLMGPAAFHRMSRPGQRRQRVKASVVLQVTGMALLLTAMTIVVFVAVRTIFNDTPTGVVFAAIVAAVGITVWYLLPRSFDRIQD